MSPATSPTFPASGSQPSLQRADCAPLEAQVEPDEGDDFLQALRAEREAFALPEGLPQRAEALAGAFLALLFPHHAPNASPQAVGGLYADFADVLSGTLGRLLEPDEASRVWAQALARLPDLHAALRADASALADGDPAASGVDEVILAYPGFYAVAVYRLAHVLCGLGVPLVPRLLAEHAHRQTGVDIHPGARIGAAFSIDHGTGVVIGETATIGDRVRIFQGVTLGALCVRKDLARQRRHPALEDDVVVYAGATILGGETVVGAGSVIGGNVWLTRSVPPGSVVTRTSEVRPRADAGDSDPFIEYHI